MTTDSMAVLSHMVAMSIGRRGHEMLQPWTSFYRVI